MSRPHVPAGAGALIVLAALLAVVAPAAGLPLAPVGPGDASPDSVIAQPPAHWYGDSRGVVLGVGGGYGRGRVLYSAPVDGATFSRDWRRGNSLELYFDLPLAERATVGVGLSAWFGGIWTSRSVLGYPEGKDDNWSLTSLAARFAWYPVGGLRLQGGVGRASVAVSFSDFAGYEQILRDAGVGWSAGLGYEIGVAKGLALVPAVEWRGLELGSGNRAESLVLVLAASLTP
jgi:hypothetical protein